MKATWNGQTIAEAEQDELIKIEGNWYFPPDSIKKEFFTDSDMHTECFWKGTASYYDVNVDGQVNDGAAWYYPVPKEGSVEQVKKISQTMSRSGAVSKYMRKSLLLVGAGAVIVGAMAVLGITTMKSNTTTTTNSPKKSYVALGDSIAAGIGLEPYSDASACNRTDASYPKLVAKHRSYELTSTACSGATIDAGVLGPQVVNGLSVSAQLDILQPNAKPDLITLTIGANDVGWTRFLSCYQTSCGTDVDRADFATRLQALRVSLNNVLTRINEIYKSDPPSVVVTGYYDIVPQQPVNACSDLAGIDFAEQQWIRTIVSDLNETIKTEVARYDFVQYAVPDFAGHELCSNDPWIQNIGEKAPFHPTTRGQQAIAESIMDILGKNK